MKLYFSTKRVRFEIRIMDFDCTRAAYYYFGLFIRFRNHELIVDVYRPKSQELLYHIKLPFISIMNDMERKVFEVKNGTMGCGVRCTAMPVVTGRVFGKELNR